MNYNKPRTLGHTGLKVGRLGIASSYGAPAKAFEEAFERGCNYFVWNTFIRGRSKEMLTAIRNIIKKGQRDKLVIAMHSYGHNAILNRFYLQRSLKLLGIDYLDIMLLGYYSWRPAQLVINGALNLKEKNLIRFIGLTGHNRSLFPKLDREKIFDVFHVRYNAVHRGAEKDVFPLIGQDKRPGIVAFTATRWGQLLDPKKMPPDETVLTAADCYRFVLADPHVDVVLTGPENLDQMRENLSVLDTQAPDDSEMERIRLIGDYIYMKK
jgi:aryl-alcohol dehydrogenase-like predicted oxidoreductase